MNSQHAANLTGYALNLNMEMGLLVRGGNLPGRAAGHLKQLIEEGVLCLSRRTFGEANKGVCG